MLGCQRSWRGRRVCLVCKGAAWNAEHGGGPTGVLHVLCHGRRVQTHAGQGEKVHDVKPSAAADHELHPRPAARAWGGAPHANRFQLHLVQGRLTSLPWKRDRSVLLPCFCASLTTGAGMVSPQARPHLGGASTRVSLLDSINERRHLGGCDNNGDTPGIATYGPGSIPGQRNHNQRSRSRYNRQRNKSFSPSEGRIT